MEKFVATARAQARGLIGTWVKIPSLATVELADFSQRGLVDNAADYPLPPQLAGA